MSQVKVKCNLPLKKNTRISSTGINNFRTVSMARKSARKSRNHPVLTKPKKRLGIAKGKFTIPDDFDRWDDDIFDPFEGA